MDILIKSFNRPYYLDRCIQSIYRNVVDSEFEIKILDDGTPEKYLEKIRSKFPKVQILKSEFYKEKSDKISRQDVLKNPKIPIDLWVNTAVNASEYFLLLEDDIWLTEKINLGESQTTLENNKVLLLKLFWLNNPKLIHGTNVKSEAELTIYKPKVFTRNPLFFKLIFGITRFKNRKIMEFLNLYSKNRALHYYSIYSVAGAIFNKKYFLSLWETHQNIVDENLQLKSAVKFWYKNSKLQFARTNKEFVATGFSSSATNKDFETRNFDIYTFNRILNEAWFNDEWDVMSDFPNDFSKSAIEFLLMKEDHLKAQVKDWNLWVLHFKNQFQKIGCNI